MVSFLFCNFIETMKQIVRQGNVDVINCTPQLKKFLPQFFFGFSFFPYSSVYAKHPTLENQTHYYRLLIGTAAASRVFNEALAKIAVNAQQGGTTDIGKCNQPILNSSWRLNFVIARVHIAYREIDNDKV